MRILSIILISSFLSLSAFADTTDQKWMNKVEISKVGEKASVFYCLWHTVIKTKDNQCGHYLLLRVQKEPEKKTEMVKMDIDSIEATL